VDTVPEQFAVKEKPIPIDDFDISKLHPVIPSFSASRANSVVSLLQSLVSTRSLVPSGSTTDGSTLVLIWAKAISTLQYGPQEEKEEESWEEDIGTFPEIAYSMQVGKRGGKSSRKGRT
jgi:hypothetical protein